MPLVSAFILYPFLYVEINYVQILEALQVKVYKYDQNFAFDFIYVQVIADAHNYCTW